MAERAALRVIRGSHTRLPKTDLDALLNDPRLRAFHAGRSDDLPPLYMAYLRKRLGRYAGMLTDAGLRPVQPEALALGRVRQAAPA